MNKKRNHKIAPLLALLLSLALLAACAAPAASGAPSSALPAEGSAVTSQAAGGAASAPEEAGAQEPAAEDGYVIERLSRETETPMGEKDTWSIFIYMCGSDLESGASMASFNLQQLLDNPPGDNVNIVVQTGGAKQWGQPMDAELAEFFGLPDEFASHVVDPTVLQRYEVTDELTLVDEQELASMGDQDTLYDFLSWGVENYPAEKMGVVFWNHGGGSLSGVCFDELYDMDSLFLFELENAFDRVYKEMTDKFEFVGFDACLMATLETANVLAPHARYMFASEETEAGFGWDYSAITAALARDPGMTGGTLGTALCDTFFDFYRSLGIGMENTATLSVVDLSKIDAVMYALDDFARSLDAGFADPVFFGEASRNASRAQNYLVENMVDLGDLAEKMENLLPEESDALYTAVQDAVVHNVSGSSRAYSNGLSVFYPKAISGDTILLYGTCYATPAYYRYLDRMQHEKLKLMLSGEQLVRVAQEPAVDAEGGYVMQIDPATTDYVREVGFMLFLAPAGNSSVYFLGYDNDVNVDWETGEIQDNFQANWAQIDGEPLMITLTDYTEEYNLYTSPIMLNGQRTNLQLKWVWNAGEEHNGHYEILGTWSGVDPYTGMASRESRPLTAGDTIVPLYGVLPYDAVTSEEDADPEDYLDENGELVLAPGSSIIIREDTEVVHGPAEVGQYLYQFVATDVYGEEITYAPVALDVNEPGVVARQTAAAEEGEEGQADASTAEQ